MENQENEIVIRQSSGGEVITPDQVVKQIEMIHDLYTRVMKRDLHFGKIPGVDKDTLFKAGAEKLNLMFRLVPKVDNRQEVDLGNGHREVKYVIGLYKVGSEEFHGHGIGSCSTLETKYRYRWQSTDKKPDKEDAESMKIRGLGRWK